MKLGLIGVGQWGKNYISTIGRMQDVSLGAVCRQSVQPPPGIPSDCAFFTNWHEMLNIIHRTNMCDGIIISTPPDSHISIAIEAKRLGIPTMIEKPLAMTAKEVKLLMDAEGSTLFLVNHIHLFAQAYEVLREQISWPIVAIQSAKWNQGPYRDYSSLHDYGSHIIAMCIDIMAKIPDTVRATRVPTKYGEIFNVVMGWEDKRGRVPAVVRVGNGGESKKHLFQVFGEGTELEYDDISTDKLRMNGAVIDVGKESALDSAINAFVKSIRGVCDHRCGLKTAYDVAIVLDACVASMACSET